MCAEDSLALAQRLERGRAPRLERLDGERVGHLALDGEPRRVGSDRIGSCVLGGFEDEA